MPNVQANRGLIRIVPSAPHDLERYCQDFPKRAFSDASAIAYCMTGEYQVASLRVEHKQVQVNILG
jgi:hypothetical protein